jgi:ABC-type branched-subunit amino acid transport system ATPase component
MNGRERPIARIEGVTQRYGKAIALDAVSIELPAGCMVGFIGPDGVGKSSLLSIIAGARRVQSGNVFVLNGDIKDSAHRAAIFASPICLKDWARTFMQTSASARTSSSSGANLRPPARNRTRAVFRPSGEEIIRRHAAEARALLLPHPRSRSPDP